MRRVIADPCYRLRMALNDAKPKKKPKPRIAIDKPVDVALRTAKGTPTRAGLGLQRGVRDTLRPLIESYFSHGYAPEEILATVTEAVNDLCRAREEIR